jgi:hypothetical protein
MGFGLILAMAALLFLPGCGGPPPSRVEFNNSFADRNARLYKAGRAFRKTLDPLFKEGRRPTVADTKKARDDARTTLEDVSTEFRKMRMPRKAGNAQDMADAYKDFLDTEEEIINKDYDKIIKVLEDDKEYPSMDDKKNEIENILDNIDSKEGKKLKVFHEQQDTFAKSFNFQVKTAPAGSKTPKGQGGGK